MCANGLQTIKVVPASCTGTSPVDGAGTHQVDGMDGWRSEMSRGFFRLFFLPLDDVSVDSVSLFSQKPDFEN